MNVSGSHGQRTPFQIAVREDHPITAGLPKLWMHQGDELYGRMRGPGKNMTVPFAHAWTFAQGKIVKFVQYTDTLVMARSLGL